MIHFSDTELWSYIEEDVPYADLTTFGLGISSAKAAMRFYPKNSATVISGVDEAARICSLLGLDIIERAAWGTVAEKGDTVLNVSGNGESVNKAWKVCQNILEYSCGIAEFTNKMVSEAKKYNKNIEILTTRKSMPGTKKIVLKAILAGGALPHRLGLSDSVLVFKAHRNLCGDFERNFVMLKSRLKENRVIIEAENYEEAMVYAALGADVIQCERFDPAALAEFVKEAKARYPYIRISATGGVNLENIGRYAATGVDMIVTSKPYHALPADIKTEITAIG